MSTRIAKLCLLASPLFSQSINVTDKMPGVSVERQENANAVTMSAEELDLLPALNNDIISPLLDFLNAASGMPSIVIDGVETDRTALSANAVEEVRINQDPYAAEFARPGSSRIEITTRKAEQKFRGSVQASFRDSTLDARNAFAVSKPKEQRRRIDSRISGPVKDSGFVMTFEHEQESTQSIVYARLPQGELRQNVRTPESDLEWSGSWQRNRSNGNALSLRYQFERERAGNSGTGGFALPETGATESSRAQELSVNWRRLLTEGVLNELSLRFEDELETVASLHPQQQRIMVEGAFTGGSAQRDSRERELDSKINHIFSSSRGKHFIRGGYQIPRISRVSVQERSNRAGTVVYSNLASYINGTPLSTTEQTGSGEVTVWRRDISFFAQDDWRLQPNLLLGLGIRWDSQAAVSSRANFAPRLSLAYGIAKKHAIRVGAGLFYDRLDGSALVSNRLRDGIRLREVLTIFGGGETLVRSSVFRLQEDIQSPTLLQYSVGMDSKWNSALSTSVNYVRNSGERLYRSRTFPLLGIRQLVESTGSMSAHSVETSVRARIQKQWTLSLQYRYGHAYDDTSGVDSFPADSGRLADEWARASYDVRHRLQAMGTFDAWKQFQIGWFYRLQSGAPYNVTTGSDDNGDGLTRDRPTGMVRNALEGSGSRTLDLRVMKEFGTIRLGVDAFNALNQVNYTSFTGNLASPFFGRAVAARPARRFQASVGARF